VCLNDNMNKSGVDSDVEMVIHDFYESFFPRPSAFELPVGEYNRFMYVDELRHHRATKNVRKFSWIVFGGVVLAFVYCMFQLRDPTSFIAKIYHDRKKKYRSQNLMRLVDDV